MKNSLIILISFLALTSVHAQERITEIIQSKVEFSWITDTPTFTKTSASFFNKQNVDSYHIGELQISGFNKPFAWDSDLTMLEFISSQLKSYKLLTGTDADENYLGQKIIWNNNLSTMLWFRDEIYKTKLSHWYLIGRSDCRGTINFPHIQFEQTLQVKNPRLNRETGLFIIPYDSRISSISKNETALKTTGGITISGEGFDLDTDGINDAFIYYETVDPSADLPSTYKRLLVNVGGEWILKWQHLDESCI